MRVALYTRISPNSVKNDTINQERDLIEYVRRQEGWSIYRIYKDLHISGSKKGKDRPEFSQMMNDAYQKRYDILLFWSLDRLSREGVGETIAYLTKLTSYGIEYKSFTEQYLDSCGIFKDVVIAIMATIAKQERVRLIERTLAGIETARAKGVKLGRPPSRVDIETLRRMRDEGKSFKQISVEYYYVDKKGKRRGVSEATTYRILKGYERKMKGEGV
jgi:DNA invertase Pin-like site-specific DNA recombinase